MRVKGGGASLHTILPIEKRSFFISALEIEDPFH